MRAHAVALAVAVLTGVASSSPNLLDCTASTRALDGSNATAHTWTCTGVARIRRIDSSWALDDAARRSRQRVRRQATGSGNSDGTGSTTDTTSAGTSDSVAAPTTTKTTAAQVEQPTTTTTTTQPPPPTTTTPAQTSSSPAQTETTSTNPPAQQTTSAQPSPTTSQPSQEQTTTTGPAAATTTTAPDVTSTTTSTAASKTSVASSESDASSAAAAESSRSSASSASAAAASTASGSTTLITHTYTSTFTNPDGSIGTSTGTLTSASVVPVQNNSGSSNAAKTWGIVGGVVGGVVVVTALVFLVYRLTQRRFSRLNDDDVDDIKWPDLLPDGQEISATTSTLKPLDTHRTNGAGVGDDGMTEYGGEGGSGAEGGDRGMYGLGAAGGVYAPVSDGRRASSATLLSQRAYHDPYAAAPPFADHSRQASYEQLAMVDGGADAYAHGYDPFGGRAGPLQGSMLPPPPSSQGTVYPPSPPQYQYQQKQQQFAGPPAAIPRGAPGAAGAARVASPPPASSRPQSPPRGFSQLPSIRRTESPIALPGLGNDQEKGPL